MANPPNGESRGNFTQTLTLIAFMAPGGGVRSVTKAPLSELTLLDLHHQ